MDPFLQENGPFYPTLPKWPTVEVHQQARHVVPEGPDLVVVAWLVGTAAPP